MGKLTLLNASIDVLACSGGNTWKGIEIWSEQGSAGQSLDPGTQMPAGSFGFLEVINSSVSNAQTAIQLGQYDANGQFILLTAAGLVHSENSKYINNKVAVQFNPYFVYGPGNDNKSYFKRDTFIVNEEYEISTNPEAGIKIEKTHLVDIIGCYFQEIVYYTSQAIKCRDGSFRAIDYCANPSNCSSSLIRNKFVGFNRSIYISTGIMNTPSLIDHCIFDQTATPAKPLSNYWKGEVYVLNNFGTKIINNTFMVRAEPGFNKPISYGLYLDNCDGYIVEQNAFSAISNIKTGGIFVNNSGSNPNSIYNNTFNNFQQGIWCQNLNYAPANGSGLILNCNDFLSSRYNIGVQSDPASYACAPPCVPSPVPPGGIATTQGLAVPNPLLNVRNTYAVLSCDNNAENKFYVNAATPADLTSFAVTSHGSFQGTQWHPTPQTNNSCSNVLEVVVYQGLNAPGPNKSAYCPANYLSTFASKALSDSSTAERQKISALKTELEDKTDGGTTGTLLDFIDSENEQADIRDLLLGKDYLSDAVLKKYFLHPEAPHHYLRDVFEKNAPVHPQVWKIVPQIGLTPGEQLDWDSLQGRNRLSPRIQKESELSLAYTHLGLMQNEKVRRFLYDSINVGEDPLYDSIVAVYSLNELPESKMKLADTYIRMHKYTLAGETIEDLENEESGENPVCTMLSYVLELEANEAFANDMRSDSSYFDFLLSQAGSYFPHREGYARALLQSVYNYSYEEARLEPEESSGRNASATETGEALSAKDEMLMGYGIRIYPNPTRSDLIVESDHPKGNYLVKITDLSGKLLLKQICEKTCHLNIGALEDGVYFLNLYEGERLLRVKKIVLAK